MKIFFHIEYRTDWGESVNLCGIKPEPIVMTTADGVHWTAEVDLPAPKNNEPIRYRYQIARGHSVAREEWHGTERMLTTEGNEAKHVIVHDRWRDTPEWLPFHSSAFTEVWLRHDTDTPAPIGHGQSLVLKVCAPEWGKRYGILLCGSPETLGAWDAEKAVPLHKTPTGEWQTEVDAGELEFPFEYKLLLYDRREQKLIAWEEGSNRRLDAMPPASDGATLVLNDLHARFPRKEWRGAGTAIPVFSLRTTGSAGIGDFGDLRRFVDWAAETRQSIIQILPVNDTTMTHTWTDSYPYNGISIYALHPLYIDLRQLGTPTQSREADRLEEQRRRLNELEELDYEAVDRFKWSALRLFFAQEGESVLLSDEFADFFRANEHWLLPYAAYSYLRDKYATPDFRQWPEHSTYDETQIRKLCRADSPEYPEIAIFHYVQFRLHQQLSAATEYARQKGIVLKGDIPIGISRNSVEAWTEPRYFHFDGQAGAPPDDFSVNGQNWGFPTYNWEVMEQDGYRWWIRRFRKMAEYFDAYRIDHILGFFRIWEIPSHAVHGLLGQFSPALPLDKEEIRAYGLPFADDYTEPLIDEELLNSLFGRQTERAKQLFLENDMRKGRYRLNESFRTERDIKRFFDRENLPDDCPKEWRDKLYRLASNVLFVPDRQCPDKYHPRINAWQDFAYKRLSDEHRAAFDRLYHDYFYRRHNHFWHLQAMKKLPQLTQATRMLVCGEDLGMIPACVPAVMNELQILSLEIQRMPKSPRQVFGLPEHYPYFSVCTFSTHDMTTLRGWWEEDEEQTRTYGEAFLPHADPLPDTATPEVCMEIVRRQLQSRSMLCILSLQDWLSVDGKHRRGDVHAERINIPAHPRHYWRYRMHLTIEELLQCDELNERMRKEIESTHRCWT